ncbi:MAG: DUF4249 domain-containing protein [Flavipsychrobacter sp.]|nr:DUF4249 domain-containing protein [Flavipsychrobacter sp.]
MLKIKYCLLLVTIVLVASCEKEITVKLPPYNSRLVVNSSTEVGDTIIAAVGVSTSATNKSLINMGQLTVQLYVNGVYAQNMVLDSAGLNYRSTVVVVAGAQYTIQVTSSIASLGTVSASITAPTKVAISNVTRIPNARVDADGNSQDEVSVFFTDPAPAGDYYVIEFHSGADSNIQSQYNSQYSYGFCVNSSDPSIETATSDFIDLNTCLSNNKIFFHDPLFNGTRKELKFYIGSGDIGPYITPTDTLYGSVKLHHVTDAGYKYLQTSQVANDTNGDPFSEPVNVYTNVKNGYGIFTMQNTDMAFIK